MTLNAGHSADEWYWIGDAALRRRDAPEALTAFRSVLAADDGTRTLTTASASWPMAARSDDP